MRVALLLGGGIGYGETSTRRMPAFCWLVAELARRVDLTVLTWDDWRPPGTSQVDGARVVNLMPGRSLAARVLAALHDIAPEVVHGHFAAPQGELAALAGKLLGIPSVVSLGGGELSSLPEIEYGMLRTWRGRLRIRALLAAASRVSTASAEMAARALPLGIEAVPIPLGVSADCFQPSEATAGPPWRLIHVGHLTAIKGTPTLLEAMARIVAREPRTHLDAFGIDLLAGEAQRQAQALSITKHVTFHGKRPACEVRPFLRRAHLHLLPSLDEGGPVSVLEAAAVGVPTVGTRVGHLADWGVRRCWPVTRGDAAALAEGALALLRDPRRRAALGRAAQQWTRRHDAAFTARAFHSLYEELRERESP